LDPEFSFNQKFLNSSVSSLRLFRDENYLLSQTQNGTVIIYSVFFLKKNTFF